MSAGRVDNTAIALEDVQSMTEDKRCLIRKVMGIGTLIRGFFLCLYIQAVSR